MKNLCVIFLLLTLVSCATVNVNYDYERKADFDSYKTYDYYSDMNSGLSQLDQKRLLDVMDAEMSARGYTISQTPDFLIDIKTSEFRENQNSNVGLGVGGTGRNVGGGVSVGIPVGNNRLSREIVFEFVDENKMGLFWQAVSTSSFNPNAKPEKREAQFRQIVAKVLEGYPPSE